MGLFAKLFRRKSAGDQSNIPNEYKMVIACNQEFEKLMSADKYIARSDYKYLLDKYKEQIAHEELAPIVLSIFPDE